MENVPIPDFHPNFFNWLYPFLEACRKYNLTGNEIAFMMKGCNAVEDCMKLVDYWDAKEMAQNGQNTIR